MLAKSVVGFAIVGLLVAACGQSTASTAPSAAATAAAASAAASAEATAQATAAASASIAASQATGDVARNKTLIFGAVGDTLRTENNWNPLAAQATHPDSNSYGLYEELFYTNLNTGELIPWQAESYTISDDYTGVTLKLRDGVTWCDGVQFTADDVKYSLDLLKTGDPAYFDSANYKEYIKSVDIVDKLTLQITLNKPAPKWFKEEFTLGRDPYAIAPKHIFEKEDPKTFKFYDPAKGYPCTTGPFKIVSSTPDKLVLEPRDKWWGVDTGFQKWPEVKREIFIPIKDQQACANLYMTNEVDMCFDLPTGLLVSTMAQKPEVRSWSKEGPIWGAPDGCLYNFAFNTSKPPWNDVNVRLAVNYAFDRQKITDLAFEGAMPTAILPFSGYFAPQYVPGRIQAVLDKYDRGTQSQAKVDDYMAKAGFAKNAAGFWAKDGKQLDVYFSYLDFMKAIGPVLQQQLIAAGFNTTSKLDPKWDSKVFPGTQDNWVLVHCNSFGDPFAAYQGYQSKYAVPERDTVHPVVRLQPMEEPRVRHAHGQHGGRARRQRPGQQVHGLERSGDRDLPRGDARGHPHRRVPHDDLQRALLDGLRGQGRPVRRAVLLLLGRQLPLPLPPQAHQRGVAPPSSKPRMDPSPSGAFPFAATGDDRVGEAC